MARSARDSAQEAGSALERHINRLVNEALGNYDWQYRESAGAAWVPPVDIFEEADAVRIMAEVPGVRPGDVKISVQGNLLTIHGTKELSPQGGREQVVHRSERTHGAFERSFALPASVDTNVIKAAYDLGVLTVTLPKIERAKPRQIQVEVASK
ncbi:MAG TPA: Hsp20/alpha crystallin family protein [Gemmatimonadales bacterium]|nr:Hsp20/alpha crystallin family protein [Gemmatimonadales bacterium]